MVILLVFHAGEPGSVPVEGNIFSSSILFFPFFIFCNKSLVAFYIKFNALAKSSHHPLFFSLFFLNFQIQTALSQLLLQICGYVIFFKFAFCQICVAIFWSQSFQRTPLKILVNFESGVHVFSGVLCRNAWNSAIHLFIIWFTDILANLDIQTELQNCLYEYGFKDKWYRLELLASVVLHVLHSDCIKIYDEVMLL